MSLDLTERLDALRARRLYRSPPLVTGPQGAHLTVAGRPVIGLCSNDYLGLASDPALRAAAHRAIDLYGVGAGASRLVSGTMEAHEAAEHALAAFVEAPSARLFATGYAANVGTVQALVGPDDLIFSDALNHASLIDGCRLSRARVFVYRHADVAHLEALLRAHRGEGRRALILSDAVFSMDGDLAPVARLRALADAHDAALMVDEAHALGVIGPGGRGVCASAGVTPDALVGTLGKAFGCAGAFVTGSSELTDLLLQRARSFVFSTAPSPILAAVAVAAAERVRAADGLRAKVAGLQARLREELSGLGYEVHPGATPIVPVLIGDAEQTMRLSAAILERGVFAQGIRPPTVAAGTSRLRLVATAAHSDDDIDQVLRAFAAVKAAGPLDPPAPNAPTVTKDPR
ncbi:MAG: 8-amino-7-oxononanoate synthase [Myxococcales bacterium]|nr:8-amino-7-oxononanoate synthase [Myxococcales bacterium]